MHGCAEQTRIHVQAKRRGSAERISPRRHSIPAQRQFSRTMVGQRAGRCFQCIPHGCSTAVFRLLLRRCCVRLEQIDLAVILPGPGSSRKPRVFRGPDRGWKFRTSCQCVRPHVPGPTSHVGRLAHTQAIRQNREFENSFGRLAHTDSHKPRRAVR